MRVSDVCRRIISLTILIHAALRLCHLADIVLKIIQCHCLANPLHLLYCRRAAGAVAEGTVCVVTAVSSSFLCQCPTSANSRLAEGILPPIPTPTFSFLTYGLFPPDISENTPSSIRLFLAGAVRLGGQLRGIVAHIHIGIQIIGRCNRNRLAGVVIIHFHNHPSGGRLTRFIRCLHFADPSDRRSGIHFPHPRIR